MSCRIVAPGGAVSGAPMPWRQMRPGEPCGVDGTVEPLFSSPSAAEEPAPQEAGGQLAAARAAAANALERAQQLERELRRKAEEAHQAGLREGEAEGRKQAEAVYREAMARMAKSVEEMAGFRARLRRDAEQDLVQLALAIAKRVLRREMSLDPQALRGLILGALERLQIQEITRVRVHPSQTAPLTACLREAGGPQVEVVPDASREPGAILFETQRGNLDASVDSQLREIEAGLADRLRRSA